MLRNESLSGKLLRSKLIIVTIHEMALEKGLEWLYNQICEWPLGSCSTQSRPRFVLLFCSGSGVSSPGYRPGQGWYRRQAVASPMHTFKATAQHVPVTGYLLILSIYIGIYIDALQYCSLAKHTVKHKMTCTLHSQLYNLWHTSANDTRRLWKCWSQQSLYITYWTWPWKIMRYSSLAGSGREEVSTTLMFAWWKSDILLALLNEEFLCPLCTSAWKSSKTWW